MSMSAFEDLEWRGLVYQVTDPAIVERINRGSITGYIGFDPTADSLHIGNLLQLLNLRRLQQAGNTPIVLAGGATGMVGDPSFKSDERQLMSIEQLRANIDSIRSQLRQFVDFDCSNSARLVNNYDWTEPVGVIDFLRDVGKHFTVNQLLARDSVRSRLEDREQGISFTEFSYALMQAFDFLHLFEHHNCELQMGASDQWGNIVAGVDLIRKVKGKQAFGVVSPLVTKCDGTKFGKSETGNIWLSPKRTSPFAFYQFLLRSADEDAVPFLKYFTFLPREEIEALAIQTRDAPQKRMAQRALAEELTRLVHGESELLRAQKATAALYSEAIRELDVTTLRDIANETRSVVCTRNDIGMTLVDALVRAGLCASKSAARTSIQQGGVSVNNGRIADVDATLERDSLLHNQFVVVRRGKKDYALLVFDQ